MKSKQLVGGPFKGYIVPDRSLDATWFTLYTVNGVPFTPANGQYYTTFPPGTVKHAYRKKNGVFTYIWSRESNPK